MNAWRSSTECIVISKKGIRMNGKFTMNETFKHIYVHARWRQHIGRVYYIEHEVMKAHHVYSEMDVVKLIYAYKKLNGE